MDEENVNVPETEEIIEETPEETPQAALEAAPEEEKPEEKPKGEPDYNDIKAENFRNLRQSNEKLQKERDQALKAYQEILAAQQALTQPSKEEAPLPEELNVQDDDIVEGRYLKKVHEELRSLKEEISNQRKQQSIMSEADAKIKRKYKDFDSVVTPDNIEMLKNLYPEEAQLLNLGTDPYSVGVTAYNMIKRYGIKEEAQLQEEDARNEQKRNLPRSAASLKARESASPLSGVSAFAKEFSELTEDEIDAIARDVDEMARRR